MPIIRGTVAGRIHRPRISARCRHWVPFDIWEAELVERWTAEGVGVETIARRLMRPVAQITTFDPVRPNGRRI